MKKYPEPTNDDFESVKKILKKRNIGLLLMLIGVPCIGIVNSAIKSEVITFAFGLLIMCCIGILLFQANFSLCPRCRNNFFTKGAIANGFASKCVHCGLSGKTDKKFREN